MFFIIYKTTNLINKKYYIGQHTTKNINDGYLGSGKALNAAIKKYGKENFRREVLYYCSSAEELNEKEKEIITIDFIKCNNNYNICEGGYGNSFKYVNRNKLNLYGKNGLPGYGFENLKPGKTIQYLKDTNPEKYRNFIEKCKTNYQKIHKFNLDWTGKKHNKETKRKISEANKISQKGSKNSQYGTMWITNGTENTKIKRLDIIPEGWYKGRVICVKNIEFGTNAES